MSAPQIDQLQKQYIHKRLLEQYHWDRGLGLGVIDVKSDQVEPQDLVADRIDLAERIEGADLVIAGEGLLDEESFHGKAVGGVVTLAAEAGVPVVILAGDAVGDWAARDRAVPYRTLVDAFGEERAWADPLGALGELVAEVLNAL